MVVSELSNSPKNPTIALSDNTVKYNLTVLIHMCTADAKYMFVTMLDGIVTLHQCYLA